MLEIDLVGADVLRPGGFDTDPLTLAKGSVVDASAGRAVDLRGYRVLPGIVDVHGDGFERHVAPRRGAMKQMDEGLRASEAELAANGITTGVLAQFVSWEGGLRGLEFADKVFCALAQLRGSCATDLRGQLRFETHQLDLYDGLAKRVAGWGLDYVVFNDHLPHGRLAQGKRPPGLTGQALKTGRNPDAHFAALLELHAQSAKTGPALDAVCAKLVGQGVRLGSHDDRTREDRAIWHARGAHVAEFPETLEAAEAAKARGDMVVLGAPNVVRGGSHKRNVSALDLIAMGLCDALASDYHYPSPRRAALFLARSGVLDFEGAWGLISSGPAAVLGLRDRGQLVPGQRADLVVLDADDRIAATMSGGRFSFMSGDVVERLIAAGDVPARHAVASV